MAVVPPPPVAPPPPPDEVFKVINLQIKTIIQQIQSKVGMSGSARNRIVNSIVKQLENLQMNINTCIAKLKTNNAVQINQDPNTKQYSSHKNGTFRNNTNPQYSDLTTNIGNFIANANYDANGTLEYGGESINIDNIADETVQTLGTVFDKNLDLSDQTNVASLNARLRNCQYLEILYLVKHEELMKTFAFLLNLYEKYQYAIKLLLFILKHLLNHNCAAPPPGAIGAIGAPPGVAAAKTIKLPKALIGNIKDLLKDQKEVQSIIEQMSKQLDSPMIKNLQDQLNPTPDSLKTISGGLNDIVNPK